MTLNRRTFLKQTAAASLLPALHLSASADDGFRVLTARKTSAKLAGADGPDSEVWGYDGQVPGPLIRARRGEEIRIRFKNELDTPTSVHWHGIRIDNAMDGVADLTQDAVAPGGQFDYVFKAPDAGTYWYHAHNKSWREVARGLHGPLIIDEDKPLFPPSDDIMLVLDDWRVDRQGRFDTGSLGSMMDWSHAGRLGNRLHVNGTRRPDFPVVAGRWYRVRVLNACNASILYIDPNRIGARVIAYDGQLTGDPVTLPDGPHPLTPAQRIDLLVRFDKPGPVSFGLETNDGPFPFATFQVGPAEAAGPPLPELTQARLPEPDLSNARTFKLLMEGGAMGRMRHLTHKGEKLSRELIMSTGRLWGMNGRTEFPEDPFFKVKKGETVVIETRNETAFAHAMHTHGHHFRVIERNGVATNDDTWRDTFLIERAETVKIAYVADNPGKWLYHCHMLEHAAAGMITWFDVA